MSSQLRIGLNPKTNVCGSSVGESNLNFVVIDMFDIDVIIVCSTIAVTRDILHPVDNYGDLCVF